jgi:hypothetical protein
MTDSRTNGADPNGYNVYRFTDPCDESKQELIGSCASLATARAFALNKGGHQIQFGLDGAVENL